MDHHRDNCYDDDCNGCDGGQYAHDARVRDDAARWAEWARNRDAERAALAAPVPS